METLKERCLTALKMPTVRPALSDVEGDWCQNPHLSTTELTPLEARLAAERPALCEGLKKLRGLIGESAYAKHISGLHNLTRGGQTLLMVAGSFMQRSLLEREFIPQIKQAFGVSEVRIVA